MKKSKILIASLLASALVLSGCSLDALKDFNPMDFINDIVNKLIPGRSSGSSGSSDTGSGSGSSGTSDTGSSDTGSSDTSGSSEEEELQPYAPFDPTEDGSYTATINFVTDYAELKNEFPYVDPNTGVFKVVMGGLPVQVVDCFVGSYNNSGYLMMQNNKSGVDWTANNGLAYFASTYPLGSITKVAFTVGSSASTAQNYDITLSKTPITSAQTGGAAIGGTGGQVTAAASEGYSYFAISTKNKAKNGQIGTLTIEWTIGDVGPGPGPQPQEGWSDADKALMEQYLGLTIPAYPGTWDAWAADEDEEGVPFLYSKSSDAVLSEVEAAMLADGWVADEQDESDGSYYFIKDLPNGDDVCVNPYPGEQGGVVVEAWVESGEVPPGPGPQPQEGDYSVTLDFVQKYSVYKPSFPQVAADTGVYTVTLEGLDFNAVGCYTGSYSGSGYLMMKNKDSFASTSGLAYIANASSLGAITKVEVSIPSGASGSQKYDITLSKDPITEAQSSGVEVAGNNTTGSATASVDDGFGYFAVSTKASGYNGQLGTLTIEYTIKGEPGPGPQPQEGWSDADKALMDQFLHVEVPQVSGSWSSWVEDETGTADGCNGYGPGTIWSVSAEAELETVLSELSSAEGWVDEGQNSYGDNMVSYYFENGDITTLFVWANESGVFINGGFEAAPSITTDTDWSDADKATMMDVLTMVVPFMAFGEDYMFIDQGYELVLVDYFNQDLTEAYFALLAETEGWEEGTYTEEYEGQTYTYDDYFFELEDGSTVICIAMFSSENGNTIFFMYEPFMTTVEKFPSDVVAEYLGSDMYVVPPFEAELYNYYFDQQGVLHIESEIEADLAPSYAELAAAAGFAVVHEEETGDSYAHGYYVASVWEETVSLEFATFTVADEVEEGAEQTYSDVGFALIIEKSEPVSNFYAEFPGEVINSYMQEFEIPGAIPEIANGSEKPIKVVVQSYEEIVAMYAELLEECEAYAASLGYPGYGEYVFANTYGFEYAEVPYVAAEQAGLYVGYYGDSVLEIKAAFEGAGFEVSEILEEGESTGIYEAVSGELSVMIFFDEYEGGSFFKISEPVELPSGWTEEDLALMAQYLGDYVVPEFEGIWSEWYYDEEADFENLIQTYSSTTSVEEVVAVLEGLGFEVVGDDGYGDPVYGIPTEQEGVTFCICPWSYYGSTVVDAWLHEGELPQPQVGWSEEDMALMEEKLGVVLPELSGTWYGWFDGQDEDVPSLIQGYVSGGTNVATIQSELVGYEFELVGDDGYGNNVYGYQIGENTVLYLCAWDYEGMVILDAWVEEGEVTPVEEGWSSADLALMQEALGLEVPQFDGTWSAWAYGEENEYIFASSVNADGKDIVDVLEKAGYSPLEEEGVVAYYIQNKEEEYVGVIVQEAEGGVMVMAGLIELEPQPAQSYVLDLSTATMNSVGNYTSVCHITSGELSWTTLGGNNNNGDWKFLKFGHKTYDHVDFIQTEFVASGSSVTIEFGGLDTDYRAELENITEIRVYVSSSAFGEVVCSDESLLVATISGENLPATTQAVQDFVIDLGGSYSGYFQIVLVIANDELPNANNYENNGTVIVLSVTIE